MDIKVGSQEEIKAEERLQMARIKSEERKWKAQFKQDMINQRRQDWIEFINRNEWMGLVITVAAFVISITAFICILKVVSVLFK